MMIRRLLLTGCFLSLVACSTVRLNPAQQGIPIEPAIDASSACASGCIYVTEPKISKGLLGAILAFPRSASGNVAPVKAIVGAHTQLSYAQGVALDSDRNIYVANRDVNRITIFAAGSDGDVAPLRTIAGPNTRLSQPTGLAVGSAGDIYVANQGKPSLTIYAPRANGDERPVRSISGTKTRLNCPWGVATDPGGEIYVANGCIPFSVTVYARGASGNVAPLRRIEGARTELAGNYGLAVGESHYIYVTNWQTDTIAVFAPSSTGDARPSRLISGPGLVGPWGIWVDSLGQAYVANWGLDSGPPSISVFAAGAKGRVAPIREIYGSRSRLRFPSGVAP